PHCCCLYRQPSRDVAPGMQDAPDVDVILVRDVEDEKGIAPQSPYPKSGQVQFVGIAQRTQARVSSDLPETGFECIDESQGRRFASLGTIEVDRFVRVPLSPSPRADRLRRHAAPLRLARVRNASNPVSSAGAVWGDVAPAKSGRRQACRP